ncbi:MAG TPA: type II toxin-antitoxin system VapC family toxin [Stellaceae bacterium]|nr:type II toxin-antitoxin system VapC family toxin [Stellaceae bacterium]
MSYLLDTVVASEMRKRQANPNVLRWLRAKPAGSLFFSTITIGEIERGISRERTVNPPFAAALASWLEELIDAYGDRILPIDIAVARRWGRLTQRLGHAGVDLLIAATALEHGLTVATRNIRHFLPTEAAVEDPFAD